MPPKLDSNRYQKVKSHLGGMNKHTYQPLTNSDPPKKSGPGAFCANSGGLVLAMKRRRTRKHHWLATLKAYLPAFGQPHSGNLKFDRSFFQRSCHCQFETAAHLHILKEGCNHFKNDSTNQYTRGFGTWSQYKLNKPCMFRYTMIYSSPVDILYACIPT